MDRKEFVKGAVAAEGTAVLSHHAFATEGEENENRFRRFYRYFGWCVFSGLVTTNVQMTAKW